MIVKDRSPKRETDWLIVPKSEMQCLSCRVVAAFTVMRVLDRIAWCQTPEEMEAEIEKIRDEVAKVHGELAAPEGAK